MPQATATAATEKKSQSNDTKKAFLDKEKAKERLFGILELDWKTERRSPLVCVTCPLTEKNGAELILRMMPGLLEQDLQLVLMGIGTGKYQSYFTEMAARHPEKIAILEDGEKNKEALRHAADILLSSSQSEECSYEMTAAMEQGVVPVALDQPGLVDYNLVQEVGNSFVCRQASEWSLFGGLIRALENFKFPYDWKNIQKAVLGM